MGWGGWGLERLLDGTVVDMASMVASSPLPSLFVLVLCMGFTLEKIEQGRIDEFQEFMYSFELIETPFKGMAYTWDNKRNGGRTFGSGLIVPWGTLLFLRAFQFSRELTSLSLASLPPTSENGSQQCVILSKLEETWLCEEMFWHQRSRVNWIKYGDKNSRFFHLSTIHRSQRNKIHMLENDQGDWVENSDQLHKLILDHFNAIYSSSGDRDFDGILDTSTPVVTRSMSIHLES
ncbi:hypothetical protein Tco_0607046 [Tanacetum coccineum]